MNLPYLTPDVPGIGGIIKDRPEDFFVQELPLYEASGEGEHVYCEIQKVGMTTFQAIDRIAAALNVSPRGIGYAGMKDAQAVSRQIFSILNTTEQAVMAIQLPELSVQWAMRHGNKLRIGHLAGNRFAIRIRDVNPTDVVRVQPVLKLIQERGMPNYFGEQRFGRRGNNHLLGAALIRGDDAAVLKLLLGSPDTELDDSNTLGARKAYEANDLNRSMHLWPRRSGMERRILARLMKTKKPGAAVRAVDEKIRRLWISAVQSDMFNQVVARRLGTLGQLIKGDLAWKHDSGAVFRVDEPAVEQPRADAFELSPSGPLVGYRMTLPEGEPLAIEQQVLGESELSADDFRSEGRHKIKGARRPLRVQPKDAELSGGVDDHGPFITVAFSLPAGSFATVLLREIMKSDDTEADEGVPAEAHAQE